MPIAQAMYAAPTRQTVALVAVSHCHNRPQTHSRHLLPPHNFYRTQVRSLSFLVPQSEVLLLNFVQIIFLKGAGSFHIHRKTMKELCILAVLGIWERPNLAQNLVTHRH